MVNIPKITNTLNTLINKETASNPLEQLIFVADVGIQTVYPFKDWNIDRQEQKAEIRLLNVEETIEATEYAEQFPVYTRENKLKIELLIRYLVTVGGVALCTSDDVKKFSNHFNLFSTKNEISELEYKRVLVSCWEHYVVNTFDSIYLQLQAKQKRDVLGHVLCGTCGSLYSKNDTVVKEGQIIDKYPQQKGLYIAEIICQNCLKKQPKKEQSKKPLIDENIKFKKEVVKQQKEELKCLYCQEIFKDEKTLFEHIKICKKNPINNVE